MRSYIFLFIIIFNLGCSFESNKKIDSEKEEIVNLTENKLNDPRWIKIDSLNCYLFDINVDSQKIKNDISIKWDGNCFEGKANGFGKVLKYKNGEFVSEYIGNYSNGIRKGKGKLTFNNGKSGEGDFYYLPHGNYKNTYPNGETFEGIYNQSEKFIGKKTNINGSITYYFEGDSISKEKFEKKITKKNDFIYPKIGEPIKIYYDENWNIIENLQEAKYYRLVNFESKYYPKNGLVQDFYISGKIQNKFYVSYLDSKYDGLMIHDSIDQRYTEKGILTDETSYKYGQVESDINWDEEGNLITKYLYKFGKIKELDNITARYKSIYNDSLNNLDKREFYRFYEDGTIKTKGINRRFSDGIWYPNGITEIYNQDGTSEQEFFVDFGELDLSTYEKTNFKFNPPKAEIEYSEKTDYSIFYDINSPIDLNGDFAISFDIEKIKGAGELYGIGFGFVDSENYNSFLISSKGYFKIDKALKGINIPISEWTKDKSINKYNSTNLIKILKFDKKIYFSINGDIVKTIDNINLLSNNITLVIEGGQTFSVNYLRVQKFISKQETKKDTPININPKEEKIKWTGSGSGVIFSKDGLIATNHHVIEGATDIEVSFNYGREIKKYKASLIKSDELNDLSIIKIDDFEFEEFNNIPYNFKTDLSRVGEDIFTLGYPLTSILGEEIKLTDGRISSKTGFQGDIRLYQTTAPMQPGNSGGPLFDFRGNLIGINSSVVKKEIAENVSYSIKSVYLKNLIDVLPFKVELPDDKSLTRKNIAEQVEILSRYTVLIKTR